MHFDFSSKEELYDKISEITKECYSKALENIFYLEDYNKRNYVGYMVHLRDAYSHIANIFRHEDILSPQGKEFAKENLIKYQDHLDRIVVDSYMKIIELKKRYLFSSRKNKAAFEAQVAQKVADIRSGKITGKSRYACLEDLIDYLEKSINRNITLLENNS